MGMSTLGMPWETFPYIYLFVAQNTEITERQNYGQYGFVLIYAGEAG